VANHFSQLAKKSRTNGSFEKIAKEQTGKPSLDIYKLGDDVLRQSSKRITKVDESIRKLAKEVLEVDSKVVDGVVNLTGLVTLGSGEGLKYFETGRAQFYALIVFGGVIALVALFGVLGN